MSGSSASTPVYTLYPVPTSPEPQTFNISLAGVTYQLTLVYRDASTNNPLGWVLDVADASGNNILNGVPLVTGVNLFQPYPNLGFGGGLLVIPNAGSDTVPGFTDLGVNTQLYFYTTSN